jgi:hypothetical protein
MNDTASRITTLASVSLMDAHNSLFIEKQVTSTLLPTRRDAAGRSHRHLFRYTMPGSAKHVYVVDTSIVSLR